MHSALRRLLVACFLILAVAAASPASPPEPTPSPFRCPTYIDTVVPAGQDRFYGRREAGDPFLPSMQEVHNTLSNCSTIKSLKLRLASLGCSDSPDLYSFPFKLPRGSHYPSRLERLDLEGYDFNDKPWYERAMPWPSRWFRSEFERYSHWVGSGKALNWLKWLPLSKAQKNMTSLDLWLEAMDFSGIKTLSLRDYHDQGSDPNLARLLPHLKSLESLTVSGAWAKDFILALPENSLKHLSWMSSGQTGASVEPILRRHAASLRSLEWREPERMSRQRRVMTADQLAALGSMAPGLRELTIDMNQNGTWPYEHLEVLATEFPSLKNATIFMELASECRRQLEAAHDLWTSSWTELEQQADCGGEKSYSQPELTVNHTRDLFEFLVTKNSGGELTRVSFYAGNWERPWDGPLFLPDWIEYKQVWGSCSLANEGEAAARTNNEGGESRQITCAGSEIRPDDEHSGFGDKELGWQLLKGDLCGDQPGSCLYS